MLNCDALPKKGKQTCNGTKNKEKQEATYNNNINNKDIQTEKLNQIFVLFLLVLWLLLLLSNCFNFICYKRERRDRDREKE